MNNFLTPILLIAFNRPNCVKKQLKAIETLPSRKVQVSIDGPRNSQDDVKVLEVRKIVDLWSHESNHKVSVIVNNKNLGFHDHFMQAFQSFFTDNKIGLVLEDDIEFRPSYINFLDLNHDLLLKSTYWSIQGFNPSIKADSNFSQRQIIDFSPTHIHTVWGWASNASSIESFLSATSVMNKNQYLETAIRNFTETITYDPILARAIRATWIRKMNRVMSGRGTWDNWWEIAAWKSRKQSLVPTKSLSRESLDQSEDQSHPHLKIGSNWSSEDSEIVSPQILSYGNRNRIKDIESMQIWGIGRKYSWAYAVRISRELQYFSLQRDLELME
jgi:hypothetical protein